MKKILILIISSQEPPFKKMIETSLKTWDSINVDGVESIFYCGEPVKENTDKMIYFPLKESYQTMGEKTLRAYEWALKNKEFDYIARVNSSCYVNKKELIKYIQTLPDNNVFSGLKVEESTYKDKWMWGGGQYIISKDIIKLFVDNRHLWDHSIMDDMAVGFLANKLNVPYHQGRACSIEKKPSGWACFCYGEPSIEFTDFQDMNKLQNQFFIRVKQDDDRNRDEYIMKQLYQNLI
jgi:hypothetical protein